MAAEVAADLSLIQDEDVLRRMWQQTEDFGHKKEIRARMYKLREQRLKDFYTTGEVASDSTLTNIKHTATKHADSIADQGFLSMKSKEIRDSESPTRDIHRRLQADNNYWNTVQESYSTSDDGGRLVDTYERQLAGQDISSDGRTHTQSTAGEKSERSSVLEIKDDSVKQEEQRKQNAQASFSSHSKTDDGELSISASQQEERQKSSSYTTSKTGNTTSYSTSKQESSRSSSSSRQVMSSSTATSSTYKILPSGERVLVSTTTTGSGNRALTGVDDNTTNISTDSTSDNREVSNKTYLRNEKTSVSDVNNEKYDNINIRNNYNGNTEFVLNEKYDVTNRDQAFTSQNRSQISRDETDFAVRDQTTQRDGREVYRKEFRNQEVTNSEVSNTNVVDQKIMTELQKLDSYLSTQNTTGTSTPVSPHSVTGDAASWTVVSSSNGEFVFRGDTDKQHSPSERPGMIKHPSSLDLPKEPTEGQYVTTYQQSYQPKRISVEHSPTHDAFARSLRASPPPSTTRSSSKGSLDRASPDRKFKGAGSPTRSSPEKERRVSVAGSYTVEKPKEVKRKVSETLRGTNKESTTKTKRKFSTTQTKATTKVRSSTPGTSPSTSPTRQDRNVTSTSDSESDSSQLTYSKHTETSTLKRKGSLKSAENVTKTSRSSPVRSSPERSPSRKSPSPVKTTGILRKDSKTVSSSTIARSESPVKGKSISPSVSPERVPKESTDRRTNISPTSATKKSVSPTIQINSSSVKNQKIQHESTTDKLQRKTSLEKTTLQKSSDHPDDVNQIPKKQPTISEHDVNYTTQRTQSDIHVTKTIKSPDKPGSTDSLRRSTKTESEINVDVNVDKIISTNERNGITPRQESPYYNSEPEVDGRKFSEFDIHDSKFVKATTDSKVEVNEFIQTEKDVSSNDTLSRKVSNISSEAKQIVSLDEKPYDDNQLPKSAPKRPEHPAAPQLPDEVVVSKADETVHDIAERKLITQNNLNESTYDNINIDSSKKLSMETTDFITNERTEKSPIASPIHLRNRDKSPEYSSEGSVSKEIKSSRAVFEINKKSPDSSPERSAFKPIKSFRTSPETKQIDRKLNEIHPTGAVSPTSPKSAIKDDIKQKTPSSPKSRETSPVKSQSPGRSAPINRDTPSKASLLRESKSSSISPCSSPERTPVKEVNSSASPDRRTSKISKSPSPSPERKSEKKPRSQPVSSESKPSTQQPSEKLPDKKPNNFRTTRRSSIPRAEKKPIGSIKKISEVKIEIKPKPGTNVRVNSFEHKKPDQKNTVPRTVSQGSITKQSTVTKTFKSTATRDIAPKSPARTPSATKIKSTAIINVNKPTARTTVPQASKTTSNTVINITIAPKKQVNSVITKSSRISDSKKIPVNKSNVLKERNIIRKETTSKEQKIVRSNITHKDDYDGSSDRSTSVSSPETVRPAENDKNVTSNVAIRFICSTDAKTNQQFIEHESIKIHEQEDTDLENETPPDEFHVEDDEEMPISSPNQSIPRATPKTKEKPTVTKQAPVTPKKPVSTYQPTGSVKTTVHLKQPSYRPVANSVSKTTQVKPTPTKKIGPQTPLKQKISSENLTRTQSDRSISKSTVIKKDTIKVDTTKTQSKVTPRKLTTETGVAAKHVSAPKSATFKTSPKKKPLKRDTSPSSSSSSDEETEVDIPTNVSIISQDEQYINELEEIRRREEQEYASKLTATTTQEDSLLNVIIQHPKSSRESSPGYSSYDQPFCTVSDDGGSHPRYADLISEPEDVEIFDIPGKKSTARAPYETHPTQKQPKFEQVTDLDDGSDTDEKLNVSVADRVSKFLESTKEANTVKTASIINEDVTEVTKEGPKAVLKAKQMFETIAKNQTAPPAPGNKPVDILSRPSVFEARRGITTPKDKFETTPGQRPTESPEPVKKTSLTQEIINETKLSSSHDVKISSASVLREKSVSPEREIPYEKTVSTRKPEKQKPTTPSKPDSTREKSPSPARDEPIRRKSPSPARDEPIRRRSPSPVKEVSPKKPVSESTKLIVSEIKDQKSKSSEVSVKQSNHISSKRDFFEQKAKTEQSVSKGRPSSRGPATPLKTRPATAGKKVPDSRTETLSFIENEKISSPRSSPDRKTTRPSSPSKKPEKTPGTKPSTVKSTRIEKEDEVFNSTVVTRKTSRDSPDRKISSSQPKDKKEPIRPSSPAKDKKESLRSISPTKEVRESVRPVSPTKNKKDRLSPEKQLPSTKPDRRDSINKQKSPERTVRKDSVREKSPVKSSSPPREIKETSPERSLTKERKSSLKRSSPERKMSVETKTITEKHEYTRKDSSDKTLLVQQHGDVVELNRAGRFGVTLRRTSSTSSAGTPRRTSMPGGDEIEDIFQLELLEQMMEKAVGYEQRRRVRAQIRIVKKLQEEARPARKPTKSPGREVQPSGQQPDGRKPESKRQVPEKKTQVFEPTEDRKPEIKKAAPEKKPSVSDEIGVRKIVTDEIEIKKTEIRRTEPDQKPSYQRPASPTKQRVETVTRSSQQEIKPVETVKKSPVSPKQETSLARQQDVIRKSSKTESTTTTSSTVRTPVREREPCPITSSYGVGPTDEHGRPLFGLKALRRSNTSKTLTDEVVEQEHREHKQEVEVTETEEICDARGRPLFGLKALQVSSVDTQEMPEVSSTQLRGLVEKHEQQARERTTVDSQPRQKPKARLRDSFILQSQDEDTVEDNQQVTSTTTTTTTSSSTSTPHQRGGVSLRSLIQKHEGISTTGGKVHREVESKTTVVTSKSTISSDGSVSLSQDVIKGELSSKNGEEPSGKITHTKYSYQTPDVKNKTQGISSTTTTTTSLGGRRTSGPKITEIEDSEERRSSVTSETSSRRFSGTKIVDYEEIDSNKMTKDLDESQQKFSLSSSRRLSQDIDEGTTTTTATSGGSNFVSSAIKKFSGSNKTDDDDRPQKKSTTVSSAKFISSTSSSVKKSNLNSSSSVSTSSPVADNKTKTVSSTISSTTSLVQKQKDVDNEDEDKKKPLIRGDSVRALQHKFQQATVASSLKQHSSSPDSPKQKQTSQLSPVSRLSEKHDKSVVSNEGSVSSSRTVETSSTSRVTTEKTSFLDNTSKVSGVQDILTRMRNADLVVESGDTTEDQEARALLNKFLGASVILQGMEQGMKANQQQLKSNGHHSLPASPTSATLVSRVEKQRMASATSQHQDFDDLENIWDEKQLRNLLEDCSDYEGRRKIRARLRNVMAEHKACADVMAVASDVSGNSVLSQECVESKQLSTKVDESSFTHSEVHTRTSSTFATSQHRVTKANSVTSPFQKFKQLERQNSVPSRSPSDTPLFKFTDPKLARSASTIKDRLLSWVQAQTKDYKNIQIENFSTSWSNGLAFCALIHHFCPEAFDYDKLTPEQRRHNFELAFRVAEEEADIAPLLDVEDMVAMRRPDWKCVFTYVQSVYRRFHSTPEAVRP